MTEFTGLFIPSKKKRKVSVASGFGWDFTVEYGEVDHQPALRIIGANKGDPIVTTEPHTVMGKLFVPERPKDNVKTDPINKKLVVRDEVLQLLKDGELFYKINAEFDKRIVGEQETRQTIFLIGCLALYVKNKGPAAANAIINSSSGTGKDHTTSNTLDIFPIDRVIRRTRITERVLNYWHTKDKEPEWSWDFKILYLPDISNQVLNSEVIKVMCTEGSFATVVRDQHVVDLEVVGKPGIIATIAAAMPSDETARRFPIVECDDTVQQTEAIMERQAQYAASGEYINTDYSPEVLDALACLVPVDVVVPYAPLLAKCLKGNHVIMRTHFRRIIDLIKASAALHQCQRQKTAGGEVIATKEDYAIATIAIRKLTSNPLMIPLTMYDKQLLDIAQAYEKDDGWFSVADIEHLVTFMSEKSLYVHLSKLASAGLLIADRQLRFGAYKPSVVYKYHKTEFSLPDLGVIEVNEVIEAPGRPMHTQHMDSCGNITITSDTTIDSEASTSTITMEAKIP